ncbi:hypothetical protein PV327_001639 [Microctonus hyperodae]|uniref:tRNA-splicing endonuclease subunit Sen54 N-terminal domain-containing protein n=1 Tax=Microctonus hyperodae TaxID=165561 RepID=A0AA39FDW6_MICHY|nr:hypothetical protein PV327_001639 [Microctonus hyperodae]
MNDNNEQSLGQHLTVKELLSTKGICSRLIDEHNQVTRVLPKTGEKLFEPNGSWLQNKQIDTCLDTRKDLIKVERVNRLSALAVAEWLPHQNKAKVTKRSGVDWNNYGNDIRGTLYLIPEEALLLLELNCIELLYNGLPLSIQHAYELLLDSSNSDCTLSEYRVFSQLARLGYRLKRYQYEKSINGRTDEVMQQKKKVIIDPDNGGWMSKICDESPTTASCVSDEDKPEKVQKEVEEVINNIVDSLETQENDMEIIENYNENKNSNSRIKPRVEIISEETVLDPVKLVVSPAIDLSGTLDNKMVKWSGARIQRNVKLLPKRLDKKVSSLLSGDTSKVTATSQSSVNSNNGTSTVEKRKSESISSLSSKKSKQEIIELSDDDIEEIPRVMTRMEMLNYIPNIASKNCITQIISRGYIPHGIKPHKSIYKYDLAGISRIRECNRNIHVPTNASTSGDNNSLVPYQSFSRSQNSSFIQNNMSQYDHQRGRNLRCGRGRSLHNFSGIFDNHQRHHRGSVLNNYFQNHIMGYQNHFVSNSWSSFQMNVFRNIAMVGFAMRSSVMQNNMNFHQMMYTAQHNYQGQEFRRHDSSSGYSQRFSSNKRANECEKSGNKSMKMNDDTHYQASFVKMPAESWSELKRKWKESKTITIEDEDDKMDCSEVEVVQRNISPLVNAKNVGNISEIFERLRIIKPAQPKTVRRKKREYKISYKVYSNIQRYKKSDPGTPMFHLVVTRRMKNFLQPVDLNRLQQDGDCVTIMFAYVADTSISFMQAGLVSLPNVNK